MPKRKEYTIPKKCTTLETSAFYTIKDFSRLIIHAHVTHIDEKIFVNYEKPLRGTLIREFYVDEANLAYTSVDGVLFNKDKTLLLAYPPMKEDQNYTIPDGVVEISMYGFSNNKYLKTVTVPDSLTTVGRSVGIGCGIKFICSKNSPIREKLKKIQKMPSSLTSKQKEELAYKIYKWMLKNGLWKETQICFDGKYIETTDSSEQMFPEIQMFPENMDNDWKGNDTLAIFTEGPMVDYNSKGYRVEDLINNYLEKRCTSGYLARKDSTHFYVADSCDI
jgi:hypothetical protein